MPRERFLLWFSQLNINDDNVFVSPASKQFLEKLSLFERYRGRKIDSKKKWRNGIDIEIKRRRIGRTSVVLNTHLTDCLQAITYHKRPINAGTRHRRSKPLIWFRIDLFISLVEVVACVKKENNKLVIKN